MRRLLALLVVAGCSAPTTLLVEVDAASGVQVRSLTLTVRFPSGATVSRLLDGTPPALPGRALVKLADVAEQIGLSLDGLDAAGSTLHADASARSIPHQQVDVALTVGEFGADGGADLAPPDLGGPFHFERQLTITNGAAGALPAGHTVRVPLDATNFPDAKLRADLLDVRVFGASGELPRVTDLAPPGETRALWLALAQPIAAGAADGSYSIHYGDPNATASSTDASKVFALWDGFDGGALASVWNVNGAPTLGGGNLVLHANSSDAVCTTAAGDGVPALSALEWRARVSDPTSAGQLVGGSTYWYWMGYQHTGDFSPSEPWIVCIARAPSVIGGERKVATGTACAADCVGPTTGQDTAFHWYRIERTPAQTRFFLDGVLSYSIADPNDIDYSVLLRNYAATSSLHIDWIRARALAAPEPTVALGPEATVSGP